MEKFNTYKIDYTCALCVLDVLPGLSVNRKRRYCTEFSSSDKGTPDAVTEPEEQVPKFVSVRLETEQCESNPVHSHTQVNSTPKVEQCDSSHIRSDITLSSTPSHSHFETIQSTSETQSENSFLSPRSEFSPDQVIIVDNIKNPKEFRSSIQIQEKIKGFEQFQEVQLAYSLPQGGIVLHFRSSVAAEKALENWPECVFNDKEVPHRTSSKKESTVNYMKNVDTSLSEFQIGEILSSIGIKYCSIKRLHYRYGRHPMPVVQLVHASVEDKLAALQMVIPITFQNRNAFLESKKFKVIRCFNCQRFGHIARTCIYSQRCECCGRTDHLGEVCGVCVQEFVQIVQVTTEVLQKIVPYIVIMPVNSVHQQCVNNFRVLSLNCQSWNTAKKGIELVLEDYKIGVFCLSETWETSTNPVKFRNWTVFSKARPDGHGG